MNPEIKPCLNISALKQDNFL
ncbi:hypothetical protein NQ317_006350, partial [Molorchus minor]